MPTTTKLALRYCNPSTPVHQRNGVTIAPDRRSPSQSRISYHRPETHPIVGFHAGNGSGTTEWDHLDIRLGDTLSLPHTQPVALCQSGFHASRSLTDCLVYAHGPRISVVLCWGAIHETGDKFAAEHRRHVAIGDLRAMLATMFVAAGTHKDLLRTYLLELAAPHNTAYHSAYTRALNCVATPGRHKAHTLVCNRSRSNDDWTHAEPYASHQYFIDSPENDLPVVPIRANGDHTTAHHALERWMRNHIHPNFLLAQGISLLPPRHGRRPEPPFVTAKRRYDPAAHFTVQL